VIEFILTLIMSFGLVRRTAVRPPPPPPAECKLVGWTNSIPGQPIYSPPGCVPVSR
jgi:hypothetical protein